MQSFLHALDFNTIKEWGNIFRPIFHILLILFLSSFLLRFAQKIIMVLESHMRGKADNPESLKRMDTLSRVFRYIASVSIFAIAVMLILGAIGISIAPILATAGVVGIAVGFGAQSLIKDYFNGFFILLENQVRQGDVVEAGGKAGLVEEVTLRYIRLRDYDGNVHFIPNGTITTVTNMSREFAYAVINVSIAYREDVDDVFKLMRQVGEELRRSDSIGPKILGDLELAGVDKWADSAIIILCRFKVVPLEQWTVRREFLRRLKQIFDQHDIEIPFPHLTVYAGSNALPAQSLMKVFRR
ncbi:MAG: mechanosensitive ion channel family protein [Burkholderiales bacterium]